MKKSVSALIATVLLLAFSLAMGALIINVTKKSTYDISTSAENYIERSIKCTDLILNVLELNNQKFLCYNRSNQKNLEIILENQGKTNIQGIKAIILDLNDNLYTQIIKEDLGSHNATKFNISLKENDINGNFTFPPKKIIIYPILEIKSEAIDVCESPKLEMEEIRRCT